MHPLEHSLRPSPCSPGYTCDQVEEEPRPPRLRKTSKILLEAIGVTCQVEPEEKGLLGARAEETKAEEPKAAYLVGESPVLEEVQIQNKPDAKVWVSASNLYTGPALIPLQLLRLCTDRLHSALSV